MPIHCVGLQQLDGVHMVDRGSWCGGTAEQMNKQTGVLLQIKKDS
jgi:hypothetical protein